MVDKPDVWNKDLFDKLSFDYLIECVQTNRIDEWNQVYDAYLRSEWVRVFPEKKWDTRDVLELVSLNSDFIQPYYIEENFRNLMKRRLLFSGIHLEGASFTDSKFEDVTFLNAHLQGAEFAIADLKGVIFFNTHLEGANFTNANMKSTLFQGAHLERANFKLANLEGAKFLASYLNGSNFYLARLEGAQFNYSHLEGANFNYTIVRGTQFISVTIDDKTDFTGAYLAEILIEPKLRKQLERNIRKLNITNKNVFVAMKFDSHDLDSALENAIKPACLECGGLEAFTVNEKTGDGWIPQKIREGIQDARFVISDLTYRNPGVYYETGYADGLDIPVIQTCKQSWWDGEKDPLHFDIAQRNTLFWKDDMDLKQQLIMKIKELQENGK